MNDRRLFLKIKIKSLAAEAVIIRHHERRSLDHQIRSALREHRVGVVREECRATHLAYGFIRGKRRRLIEKQDVIPPATIAKAEGMVKRYGRYDAKAWTAWLTEGTVAPAPVASTVDATAFNPVDGGSNPPRRSGGLLGRIFGAAT